jgi:hypothetical protein
MYYYIVKVKISRLLQWCLFNVLNKNLMTARQAETCSLLFPALCLVYDCYE